MILIELTKNELADLIRKILQEEFSKVDQGITKKEVAAIFGVSMNTVSRMMDKGRINRINPEGQHPKFSKLEIMNLKKHKL